ncbi:MAG TPA: HEAT repeat domain-containing protein [Ktedonobacteraceae bacterium]
MQPLGKQPSFTDRANSVTTQPLRQVEQTAQAPSPAPDLQGDGSASRTGQLSNSAEAGAGLTRAPASAVNAIMGRLGLARTQDEPEADEKTLAQNLADPSWAVRVSAVQKLGKMGRQAPLGLLLAAMRDEQSSVRVAAARALSRNPRQAAISALVAALDDREWLVRAEIALALGEMRELAPLQPLLATLQDKDATVRASAARALGETRTEHARKPLQAALQDEDWSVREAATLALARLETDGQLDLFPLSSTSTSRDPFLPEIAESEILYIHAEMITDPAISSAEPEHWVKEVELPLPAALASGNAARSARVNGQPTARKRGRDAEAGSFKWPFKAMHTAEGVLAAVIITGLFMAWLAIETQPRSSQGQSNPNNSRSLTFTTYRGHDSEVTKLAWSPDGQNIASADSRGNVLLWQAGTGKTLIGYPHRGSVLSLTWYNASTVLVAYIEPVKELRVEEIFLGPEQLTQPLLQISNLPGVPSQAVWSSDKQDLAFDTGEGEVQIWNVFDNYIVAHFEEKHTQYAELAWSPDNKELATLSTSGLLETWDAESGQAVTSLTSNHLATIFAWVSCGRYNSELLVDSNSALLNWSYGRRGTQVTPFMQEQTYNLANSDNLAITSLAISPDNSQVFLATSDGPVQARDMVRGSLIYLYTGHSAQVNDIEWSPNGQHIATASMDTTVRVWQES